MRAPFLAQPLRRHQRVAEVALVLAVLVHEPFEARHLLAQAVVAIGVGDGRLSDAQVVFLMRDRRVVVTGDKFTSTSPSGDGGTIELEVPDEVLLPRNAWADKAAYDTALARHWTGPVLNRLFQSAFSVAKRVRTETQIGANAVSVREDGQWRSGPAPEGAANFLDVSGGFTADGKLLFYDVGDAYLVVELDRCPAAGDVLVAPITTPAWTPLFSMASAIVTDVGAPLSHAAIVARELGIPAVVGCGNATMLLKTGDRVRDHPRRG